MKRRFYKTVSVTPELGIALDGKPVKTPKKLPLVLPSAALAEAVAEEWRGQGEKLNPAHMWLTKLANTVIDRVAWMTAAGIWGAVEAALAAQKKAEAQAEAYRAELAALRQALDQRVRR